MKRNLIIMLLLAFGLFMVLPQSGQARGHYYPRHHHSHYYYGWVPAAIIAGAFLTTAIIVSAANQNPQTAYQPHPPPPSPAPSGYCPPPPPSRTSEPAGPAPTYSYPAGEWIAVPGQWVGNTWVPYHTVFIPENP